MARLSDEEIKERLLGLEGRHRDGEAIRREFELDDFKGSVDFGNRLTPEAEEMNHRPDLEISRNKADRERLRSGPHGGSARLTPC
jgi:4a-hydroxytetrahydrobiopterin dehydratase